MWINHEQCPECARQGRDNSHDNLGIHEDGHKYCFSCGYYEPSENSILSQFHTMEREEKQSDPNSPPSDLSNYIPPKPLTWLRKYGISDKEISDNHIAYSHTKDLLCFPVGNAGEAWQGRYFGNNPEYPKYVTYGFKSNIMHIISPDKMTVVIVEDLVSAIKVGRQFASMPLFGSDITKTQLFRLSKYYDNVVIWLDPDKYLHGVKLGQRAELFFKKVRIVMSEKDPKDHSDQEIKALIS